MAMGGFDKEAFHTEESGAPMSEINVTPFVDVMLVLLVIFLVTAPMLTQAIVLELPNETAADIPDANPLTVSIAADGRYYWGEEEIDTEQLTIRFEAAGAHNPDQPLHLRADHAATYGHVAKLLALAQQYGLRNIGFVTEPK